MGRIRAESEKGKVTTPFSVALHMVAKLFNSLIPSPTSRVLDAGCGSGVFVEAIITYVKHMDAEIPEVICIEKDENLVKLAKKKFENMPKVKVIQGDFLIAREEELGGKFDYIISNPPYISYEYIDPQSRSLYRKLFSVAKGRFDTYMLFFEKALSLLKPCGRMVFITPEKFLYVLSASNLRRLLSRYAIEEIEFVAERVFEGVLAYPVITVIRKEPPSGSTLVKLRDGKVVTASLPSDGRSWLSVIEEYRVKTSQGKCRRLEEIALRISAGVATGRDDIFVIPRMALPKELEPYAYLTVSGKDLSAFKPGDVIDYSRLRYAILLPYDRKGRLLSEEEAKPLIEYLSKFKHVLEKRYVVKHVGKKWYAFHEDPPLEYILRPKIIWRDIAFEPSFYIDEKGALIPRHSVYYLVPKDPSILHALAKYLNSPDVRAQLRARCQRAANGYLRLQSHIIKELCVPEAVLPKPIGTYK